MLNGSDSSCFLLVMHFQHQPKGQEKERISGTIMEGQPNADLGHAIVNLFLSFQINKSGHQIWQLGGLHLTKIGLVLVRSVRLWSNQANQ